MNELQAIIRACKEALAARSGAALATVVGVEGSAYRRPGARMFVTGDGQTTGTISGGCLERDVALRAAQVIESKAAMTVEYDTRGSEDIVWGLGMGCNGVVRVLIESLHAGSAGWRAMQFIAECLQERRSGLLATVISGRANPHERVAEASNTIEVGERLLLDSELNVYGLSLKDGALSACIREDALEVLACGRPTLRSYEGCDWQAEIFFDVITPPRQLVICGAEHDALPLLSLARTIGWHVTVVDPRARRATQERFASADEVVLCRAEEIAAHVSLTENTAVIIMTHNYLSDVELLRVLLPSPVRYLGILGPKQRTLKLLEEIKDARLGFAGLECARLHSPIGMDIGAETPEEIAISIICEINAVYAARGGGFLRDRDAPIHDESQPPASIKVLARPSASKSVSPVACHVS
jgi:xanthine dehydrogenase accessory factor